MQTEPESPAPRQRAAWRARAALVTALVVAVVGAAAVLWPDEPPRELRADGIVTPVAPGGPSPGSGGGEPAGPSMSTPDKTAPNPGPTRPGPPSTAPKPPASPSTSPPAGTPTTGPDTTTTTVPRGGGPGDPTTTSSTVPPKTTPTTAAPAGPNGTRPSKFTDVVAFVDTDRDAPGYHLAVLDTRRGEPRRMTRMDGTFFSWAPDGVRIAFPLSGSIHILDTTTGDVAALPGDRGTENQPVWSPDGQWIAYLDGSANQDSGLWLMHPDGSERHRISGGIMGAPAWSPDSSLIAFGALTGGATAELHVLTVDGTSLRNLTAGPGGGSAPVFSPDGAGLAFTAEDNSLAVADVATAEVRRYPTVGRAINPSWAHNGKQILVEHFDGQVTSIRSVDLADGSARQLSPTDRPAAYSRPQWIPDGSGIIYAGDCGDTAHNLCRLDQSGRVHLLVDSAGGHFAFQPRP